MWPFLGALVSGGASLLGNIFQSNQNERIAQMNIAAQQQANAANLQAQAAANAANLDQSAQARDIASAQWGQSFAENVRQYGQSFAENQRQFATNIDMQREFAQMGIRWKAEDAVAAGIHPLYGLGAAATSYAPVTAGTASGGSPAPGSYPLANIQPGSVSAVQRAASGSGIGAGLAAMGQDLGRAIAATSTADEIATNRVLKAQQIERGQIENEILKSELAKKTAAPSVAFPSKGDPFGVGAPAATRMIGGSGGGDPGEGARVGFEKGIVPGTRLARNPDGSYSLYPSKNLEELATEGPYAWEQWLKQRLYPMFSRSALAAIAPREAPAPGKGWNYFFGDWWQSPSSQLYDEARKRSLPIRREMYGERW